LLRRAARCIAANLPFGGLALFYEILYDRDNHASGRHGNRICAETNAPRLSAELRRERTAEMTAPAPLRCVPLAFVSRSATDS
jgi:hypothetical protein